MAKSATSEDCWRTIDQDPLSFLIAPQTLPSFQSTHWEQQPAHLKATEARKQLFDGLFDIDTFKAVAAQRDVDEELGPFQFGADLNAARYEGGKRTTPNGQIADLATLTALFAERCTFQVIQPQRYHDPLWRLLAALERQVGCLMGCNAYLTPKGTQGLAPHHDDVEIFVCQTQGSKRWRLYKPLNGHVLPNVPSGDLSEDVIGEPIMDVTLEVGDVLYLPRGTIHQAVAQESGDSSHLTLSTYQHWTVGSLAQHVFRAAAGVQGGPGCLPLSLRKGLPMGYPFTHGLQVTGEEMADLLCGVSASNPACTSAAGKVAAGLRELADLLEAHPQEMVTPATDGLAADFIRSRLPPHPAQLPQQGPPPLEAGDCIRVRGTGLFMIIPVEGPADPDVPEGYVKLTTCLENRREDHMMTGGGGHGHEHDHDDDSSSDGEGDLHEEGESGSDDGEDGGEGKPKKEKHVHGHGHGCGDKSCGVKHGHGHTHKPAKPVTNLIMKGMPEGFEEESDDEGEDGEGESGDEGEEGESSGEGDGSAGDELPGPVFPACYAVAIAKILAATSATGIKVSDLQVPGGEEEERVRLAFTLWSVGVVCTVPRKKKKVAENGGKKRVGGGKDGKGAQQAAGGKKAKRQ
ncbi:MAG: hypothetical protein WDW36_001432 [Sanguina aurantia]